jgi:hypothetical protein
MRVFQHPANGKDEPAEIFRAQEIFSPHLPFRPGVYPKEECFGSGERICGKYWSEVKMIREDGRPPGGLPQIFAHPP